ncbi:MAG TPA: type IV toxin-antitoxin system AbiEi family antitoxin [Myxococcota bacterium]|nr:type IV toxin-antitoxin system AbiEi family antitoxin [Myxococcota bacterium]HRY96155.1 type IV toxin-antitoxin system AbiEi family antitoxin [Myxococcota bacterium]
MLARAYIEDLVASGRYSFTSTEAFREIGSSQAAVRAQLRRLKEKGLIAEPVRSFHVIVPPEYRRLGCLPAEQFVDQLMKVWEEPYYLGLLSAAERHGAAHQRPQACQVMVRKNREALGCREVRIEFIARGDLEKMPVSRVNTLRGVVRCATPEVTALELVGYPNHAGGLSNVATVVAELAENLDAGKLLEAARLSPISWSQRLGYLLDRVGQEDLAKGLAPFVEERARSYTPLRRAAAVAPAKRSARWKLIINAEVEPEA